MRVYLKVKSYSLHRMRNAELHDFVERTLEDIPMPKQNGGYPPNTEKEFIAPAISLPHDLWEELNQLSAELLELTQESRASEETSQLAILDKQRKEGANYLFSMITNALISPRPAEREAGLLLKPKISPYAGIGYNTKDGATMLIKRLYLDLSKPKAAEAMEQLGITKAASRMKVFNDKYAALVKRREKAKKEDEGKRRSEDIRKELAAAFDELVCRAVGTNLISPNAEAAEFIEKLNRRIDETKAKTNRRDLQIE